MKDQKTGKEETDRVPNQRLSEIAAREETLLVSLVLKHLELAKDAAGSVPAEALQNETPRRLYGMALDHHRQYGQLLTRPAMESILASKCSPEEAAFLQGQYDSIHTEIVKAGEYGMLKERVRARHEQRRAYAVCRDAVERLLSATDGQREIVADIVKRMEGIAGREDDGFPRIVSAADLVAEPDDEPPQVIKGVLHQGSKAVYGGPSKAFKSWTLIDLAIAVASGEDWLGFGTTRGRVLYVNLELQQFAVRKRIRAICDDRLVETPPLLDVWNLRGHARPIREITESLRRRVEGGGYSLICPDPIYKVLSGMDENSAGDIAAVCNEIERMAVQTGAAVVWGAHYAKGNASAKESIDRISGSGVWARDPDAIITATAHEQEGAFSIEMTLRNFAPQDAFVVNWQYPRMVRDDTLNPEALRRPRTGRPSDHQVSAIMGHLGDGMAPSAWQRKCAEEDGMSRATFYRLLNEAKKESLVRKDDKGCFVREQKKDHI